MGLVTIIFAITYTSQNLIVNMIDYILYRKAYGYYNDVVFHEMFSYKLFQAVLCLLISIGYSQTINPSF